MPSAKPITLVMPYYINGGMLARHQLHWDTLPRKLKGLLHVTVVDDGSPRDPALAFVRPERPVCGLAEFRLYRCLVDIRWNWLFCRNLGAHEAATDWLLLTDIDHVLPEETLLALTHAKHDPRAVYRLSRVDAPDRTPYKPHPNTWFLTREMFFKIGGYDERFSGYYGTDAEFRDRVRAIATRVEMLPATLIRYPRDLIADASTVDYGRKEKQDRDGVTRIRAEREAETDQRPRNLTFPWERLI